jgi:AAA family ATP:ADP antiporter
MKTKLLKLLNIRTEEAWLVKNLFWLQFFQGFGVAIFNTVAFTLFLQHFDVRELPLVYLFSAALLLIAGYAYSKIEHHLSIKQLVPTIIVFVAISILIFWLEFFVLDSPAFLFVLFSWYYVIYLLTNLEFWGLAALQFDIRQSKRLFGMIGAGDIPAKLIGYSAVPILLKFFSAQNLLIFSAISIFLALVFYFKLKQAGKLDIHVKHNHEHHSADHNASARDIIKSVFGNRMIAFVALLSFIVVTCVTIIGFAFYAEIKRETYSDTQLASFIAAFYAGGRVFALFVRLLLTGRLSSRLGIKGSLLISPAILFLFLLSIILLPFISNANVAIIYVFGAMAIITEVLKTSLQDPVFLSLMQPLSSSLRLKGHTIVKGVMDPFALAFSGILLLIVFQFTPTLDLQWLSYALFVFLFMWVALIFLVDKEYVSTLVTALQKRYSVGQEMDLRNEKTQSVLAQKISDGTAGEALYILQLLGKNYRPEFLPHLRNALQHASPQVRMNALKLVEQERIMEFIPEIDAIINQKTDVSVLPEAVKTKCLLQAYDIENYDSLLEEADIQLMKSAVVGLMTSGGINAVVMAGGRLLQLVDSPLSNDRKAAAEIIGELAVTAFYKPLLALMNDNHSEVVEQAIIASGKVKNSKLLSQLQLLFLSHRFEKFVIQSFESFGTLSISTIKLLLANTSLHRQQQSKLIALCGRINHSSATSLLQDLIFTMPDQRHDILHALHIANFECGKQNNKFVALVKEYLKSATQVQEQIRFLATQKDTTVLTEALSLEFIEIRQTLLQLFSFMYNREKLTKAKIAFQSGRKEAVANALEIIEIEVSKEFSGPFILLFEDSDEAQKHTPENEIYVQTNKFTSIVSDILTNHSFHYHRWTKAAAIYSSKQISDSHTVALIKQQQNSTDNLIRETALSIS